MKHNNKTWVVLTIVAVTTALSWGGWYFYSQQNKNRRTFKEFKVERGDIEVFVQATGQVQPENRLVVKPSIPGRIEQVLIDEGNLVKAGQILAWMSSNDRAALLDMAKAKGEDEVKHWGEIYKASPIIAPLSGFVIAKNIEPGQVVATNDTAFVISNRLVVNAQVDETDLGRVKLNQDTSIQLEAYSDQPISGKVSRIAYEARTANNVTVYDIRILPNQVPTFMRSGMTASVRFLEASHENILKISVSILKDVKTVKELRKTGSEVKLLVKTGESKGGITYEERSVTLGVTDGRMVEVTSGLKGDETLLYETTPNEKSPTNPFSPFGNSRPKGKGTR